MMCKIAFFRGMQAGRGGIMKQTHRKLHCLNEKSPSIQPERQAHWIPFCLSSCSDYWAGMVHAHTQTNTHTCLSTNTKTQSLKLSYGITKAMRVLVKGSLMPLEAGNWSVFGNSLAKISIILSPAHFCWLFWSGPTPHVDSLLVF